MEVNCIVCIDNNFGISKNNIIPWNFTEDLQYFNKITLHSNSFFSEDKNAIIMGKNTFLSIGKPLKNRYNYILSTTIEFDNKDLIFCENIQEVIKDAEERSIKKIFIIGGKEIYEHFINNNLVKKIYITRINDNFNCDNTLNLNLQNYEIYENITKTYTNKINNKNYDLNYEIYENKKYINTKYWTYHENKPYCNVEELQYLDIMDKIIKQGHYRQTRNANTFSIFGCHMCFNLQNNILPLLTTKKMFTRGILEELLFFLRGETNSKLLEEKKVNIWKPNTTREFLDNNNLSHYAEGDMGPMYGFQWRHFNAEYNGCDKDYSDKGIDQLDKVMHDLQYDKYSRRILMTTYNPCQAKQGVLYPCHGLVVQFGIEDENKLCCHMYQRSADYALGVPFNITSYAFLVHILCSLLKTKNCDYVAGKLYMSFGDVHLYENHINIAKIQLERTPFLFPELKIKKEILNLQDIKYDDFEIINYKSHDKLNFEMVA